jgi:hypothetical protein
MIPAVPGVAGAFVVLNVLSEAECAQVRSAIIITESGFGDDTEI